MAKRLTFRAALDAVGRILVGVAAGCLLLSLGVVVLNHSLASQRQMEHKDPWSYHPDLLDYCAIGCYLLFDAVVASAAAMLCGGSRVRVAVAAICVMALLTYIHVHLGYIS